MILSIDPGLNNIGYSIYNNSSKKIIKTSELTLKEKCLYKKLAISYQTFLNLFEQYSFKTFLFEKPTFINKGASGQNINFNLGTILSLAAINKCEIKSYAPKEVKKVVTGNGNADKNEVARKVANYFNLTNNFSSNHASDSLAVLICFLKSHSVG